MKITSKLILGYLTSISNHIIKQKNAAEIGKGKQERQIEIFTSGIGRKRAEEALTRRERYLAALVEVERSLRTFDGSANCYTEIVRSLGSASGASRVYVFENHRSAARGLLMSQRAEWCAEGIHPEIDNPALQNLSYDDFFPQWAQLLAQGDIIAGIVAKFPDSERQVLEPQGILSILILPITVKGKFFGFIGFDNCVEAHAWEQSEVNFLQAAAVAISLAQERKQADVEMRSIASLLSKSKEELEIRVEERTAELRNANEQLHREIADRKRAESELEKSLSLLRATLESTADGILVVDRAGKIASFNQKFVQMWCIPESIVSSGISDRILAFVVDRLKDSQSFITKVGELYAQPEAESYDILEFKDGRIFERYSQPQQIGGKIVGRVWSFRDVTERKQAEETIRYQALHDLLTGLPNRMLFNERLSVSLAYARQNQDTLAVMFLDLDRFKTINDTLGHAFGDRLLQSVTERLTSCLRENDTIARWGGDEFTLLLPQIKCREDVAEIAQRILDALKPSFILEAHRLHISSSIGIALYPYDGTDAEILVRNADAALYRAKEQGRNNYQFYNSAMNSQSSELLVLENDLHHALERGEFAVYYQPQVNTTTEQIVQMEALVRWQHPKLGFISPGKFIPLAEDNGLIVPIGEWVLRTACLQNKAWQDAGLPPIGMAVNLSVRQFQQPNLVEMVERVLSETRLEPRFLELEITESTVMQNVDFAKTILSDLHQMGVRISMDDFGTGYSSLSYLKKFPVDKVKIDQSFVRDLTIDPNDAAIVAAIVALGKVLNLRVVAEGVETEEHRDLLRSLQCKEMQGYFFSRPLPALDATQLLRNSESIKAKTAPGVGVSGSCFGFTLQETK